MQRRDDCQQAPGRQKVHRHQSPQDPLPRAWIRACKRKKTSKQTWSAKFVRIPRAFSSKRGEKTPRQDCPLQEVQAPHHAASLPLLMRPLLRLTAASPLHEVLLLLPAISLSLHQEVLRPLRPLLLILLIPPPSRLPEVPALCLRLDHQLPLHLMEKMRRWRWNKNCNATWRGKFAPKNHPGLMSLSELVQTT